MAKIASTNEGIDVPAVANNSEPLSTTVFCFSALMTPSGIEIATARRIACTPRRALIGQASPMMSVTSRSRYVSETPKSPCIAFHT